MPIPRPIIPRLLLKRRISQIVLPPKPPKPSKGRPRPPRPTCRLSPYPPQTPYPVGPRTPYPPGPPTPYPPGPVVVVSPSLPCPSLEVRPVPPPKRPKPSKGPSPTPIPRPTCRPEPKETFIHHERWTDKEPKQEVSTADLPSCDVLEGKEKTKDLKELVPPSSLRDNVKNKELVSGNEAWSAEYHQWAKQVEYESEWIEDPKETFIHNESWTDKEPEQEVWKADWPSWDVLQVKEKTKDLKELVPPSSLRDNVKKKELVSGNEAWSAGYQQWAKHESERIEDPKETFIHHESWTDKEPEQEVWKADWPSWDVLQVKEKTKDLKEFVPPSSLRDNVKKKELVSGNEAWSAGYQQWAKHESEWIEDPKETFIHHESWTDKEPEQEVWKADWPSWDVLQVKEKTKDLKELVPPSSLPDNVKKKESSSEFHLVSGNEASSAEYDQRAKHQDEYELIEVEDGYQNLKPLKKRTRRGQRGKRFLKHFDLDDKKFRRIKIDARELRYSQLSCKETFQCGRSVWDLINDLWTGRVRLSARFLQLTVFETRDKNSNGVVLKCINNRRLFALKKFAKRCGNRPVMVNANVFSEDSLSEAFQIMQLQSNNNFQSPDPSCKRKCLG